MGIRLSGIVLVTLALWGCSHLVSLSPLLPPPQLAPGLGLSETWYSCIVSSSSLGELLGALVPAFLTPHFYVKHLMLAELALCLLGGVLFGIGKSGWMLLIGELAHTTST